jgi:hypothetical protein
VLVYGIHYAGNLVYNYKVINNGDTAFNNFTIGSKFDSAEGDEFPQLVRLPLGWSWGAQGEVGTEIIIPPASTKHPQSWQLSVFGQQGTSGYYLKWLTPWDERDEQTSSNQGKPSQASALQFRWKVIPLLCPQSQDNPYTQAPMKCILRVASK